MAKVALLVGVSEYEPGLNPLPGAVRDVEAVCEVLMHPEMGGFAASDIILLKNPERQTVEMAIETLFSGRHKDDLLLLYFSGHGIKDDRGRLYLATHNTSKTQQGELIRSTAVSANFIHDRMSESRSRRQVVILDSCFSGAFAEGLSAKDDGTIDIREQLGGEGRVVLTSSTSTQYSFEEQGQDLSIYTRFLIEGIKSGEADRDQDEFISIDELHEYASQKVRELQPAMKPEIYAIREGFKIRLAKVAPGDPTQRYRKEVVRFIHRGEISFVGRRTLDVLRTRLGLEPTEAKAIEDEVLEPYRNEFRDKLQQYQQVFTELLERDETITDSDRHDLQNLQQILGLRNEDTMPIEAQVTARFKTHQQNLQTYQQAFTTALRQEFPLSAASRDRLLQTQQQLELANGDIAAIESQITAEVEAYHQKLQDYERLFFTATQQEYPLSEATRNDLRQQQQRLELTDVDVAPIEAQITTQIESYHQKLQQYEQAFVKATQRQHYPDEVTQKQLQQTWQTLGLSDRDVGAIERRINAEIETHQANLKQYEQEFTEAVRQEYPLNAFNRSQLKQRHQALNLTAEDVIAIENPIVAAIEEHQQKLQQYEQVFRESIQFEYPLSDATREELQRFQYILELSAQEIAQVEAKLIENSEVIVEVLSQESEIKQDNQILVKQVVQESIEVLEPKFISKTSTSSETQFSEALRKKHSFTVSTFTKLIVAGVSALIIIIGITHLYKSSIKEQEARTIRDIMQQQQGISENVVLTQARNFQLKKQFGDCAKLMLKFADFFTDTSNKNDSQSLLSECRSSLKKESIANAQKFEQKLNLFIKNPKLPVPELYISTLTAQQLSSLNALYTKFVKVTPESNVVQSGSSVISGEWRGLCIQYNYGYCAGLNEEIKQYEKLFTDYKLVTSGDWIIYKP
ncbi:MAG: caspase, EACC1-associated type [Aulosira sp. ZfuVER01]|nr:caspase family protein [Aulosira sp. ZfuVER01]MDZ7997830.1 caspase family protein [Aulosira sp. DedVER01a]MDZ8052325.1 caspase family protein [Aulosira sp. ZfuCHP01]